MTVFYRCAVCNVRTQLCCTVCDNRIAYFDSVPNMTRIWLFCSLKRFFQTTLNYVCSTVYGPAILYMVMLYCMELCFDVVYDKGLGFTLIISYLLFCLRGCFASQLDFSVMSGRFPVFLGSASTIARTGIQHGCILENIRP